MRQILLENGRLIGGRYRIEGMLGRGGMAVVYRARHVRTDRDCALKTLLPDLAAHARLLELFENEARLGARIGAHPNIIDVFDAGLDEANNCPFLAMELLVGETLEARLERGPLLADELCLLLGQLGDALDQAHRANVIHRDLKPSNLFLVATRQGVQLKVMDFGIAKATDGARGGVATQVGTPGFAAPEQLGAVVRALAARHGIAIAADVSAATDVWALAFIAYEALTGQQAWQYWDVDTQGELPLRMLSEGVPATLRAGDRADLLPAGFDDWFARATERQAARRWPSAGQAVRELIRLVRQPRARSMVVPDVRDALAASMPSGPTELATGATLVFDEEGEIDQLHQLVARRPFDAGRLQTLYEALEKQEERRGRVAQVLVALRAATPTQEALAQASRAESQLNLKRALPPALFDTLLRHHDEGEITGAILACVLPALLKSYAALPSAKRTSVVATVDEASAVARCFTWAAAVLALPRLQLVARPDEARSARLMPKVPPDVRLGSHALDPRSPQELAFIAGRALAAAAPCRMLRAVLDSVRELHDTFAAAISIAEPRVTLRGDLDRRVRPLARAISRHLSPGERQALGDAYLRFAAAGGRTHIGMWAQGAENTAARAGLLLCHDIVAAEHVLSLDATPRKHEIVADLIAFFTGRAHARLREAMGPAGATG
jgi:serine/threonine-protein kinase